jgi:hypothetical protein
MDYKRNHLIELPDEPKIKKLFEKMYEHMPEKHYYPLPEDLEQAAKSKLDQDGTVNPETGLREAHVSKTSGGKLSKWAAAQRKKERNRRKRRTAAKSKRKNRK